LCSSLPPFVATQDQKDRHALAEQDGHEGDHIGSECTPKQGEVVGHPQHQGEDEGEGNTRYANKPEHRTKGTGEPLGHRHQTSALSTVMVVVVSWLWVLNRLDRFVHEATSSGCIWAVSPLYWLVPVPLFVSLW